MQLLRDPLPSEGIETVEIRLAGVALLQVFVRRVGLHEHGEARGLNDEQEGVLDFLFCGTCLPGPEDVGL